MFIEVNYFQSYTCHSLLLVEVKGCKQEGVKGGPGNGRGGRNYRILCIEVKMGRGSSYVLCHLPSQAVLVLTSSVYIHVTLGQEASA